jgi:glutathione synthase/RimK-type ligase-like ATP-grasp enzyme
MAGGDAARLLIIIGSDRDDRMEIAGGKLNISASSDLHLLIGRDVPFHRTLMTRNFFRQQRAPDLFGYDCILNLITEAEENGRVLENTRKLIRGFKGKVINRPEAVLQSTRDLVARKLTGIPGLAVPRVLRLRDGKTAAQSAERAGLKFPVIVRRVGTHTGRIVGRFEDMDALKSATIEGGEHFATEFVDFGGADGLYRKYRVFVLGQKRVFRHMLASEHWNVHANDRQRVMAERRELIAEEESMFAGAQGAFPDEVQQVLSAVRERIPLDFFGIDFGVAPDRRVVLFEANATMNFFPLSTDPRFAYLARCLEPARSAFAELLGLVQPAQSAA